jgi:hypothetical protein
MRLPTAERPPTKELENMSGLTLLLRWDAIVFGKLDKEHEYGQLDIWLNSEDKNILRKIIIRGF